MSSHSNRGWGPLEYITDNLFLLLSPCFPYSACDTAFYSPILVNANF